MKTVAGSPVAITLGQQLAWSSEANRAPSVHNVQPARFEWSPAADAKAPQVSLCSDQTRRLLAGDPLRLDEGTSLGAAWEGLRLATARDGWKLELVGDWLDPALSPSHPQEPSLRLVARGRLSPLTAAGVVHDPLVEHVFKRKSYRGTFAPALPSQLGLLETALVSEFADDTMLVLDSRSRSVIARQLREATARLARHEAVQAELLSWLRLNPRDPRYLEDGLNADALEIPRRLAGIAGSAMRLSSHPAILKTGLNRILLDETPQLASASAVLVLYSPVGASATERGRKLYRGWLHVTRYGLSACPMSVLADDAEAERALRSFHPRPDTVRVLNVLRIGVSPRPTLPLTPRLQPERLVLQHETRK